MKHVNVSKNRSHFKVITDGASSQAATMTLKPGDSTTDHPENEHSKAEQWVYVISGSGRAKTPSKSISLKEGSLLLIEKNEPHQITNTGKDPLVTLNFYAPAAYTPDGDVKKSVQRK
jgi:mannose-6-phosphate isomerase-like protein (cupin superfamily)